MTGTAPTGDTRPPSPGAATLPASPRAGASSTAQGPGLPDLPVVPWTGNQNPCLANMCSACCHDTEMLLTEADVTRLRRLRPGLRFHSQAADGYLQLLTRAGPPVPGHRGQPCVFLDDAGRCTVWAVRPEGCRLYPAVWDDQAGAVLLDAEHCPHTTGFTPDGRTDEALADLARRLHAERDARGQARPMA